MIITTLTANVTVDDDVFGCRKGRGQWTGSLTPSHCPYCTIGEVDYYPFNYYDYDYYYYYYLQLFVV